MPAGADADPRVRSRPLLASLALFAFALALRLGMLFELRDSHWLELPIGDGQGYDLWARAILAGGGGEPAVFFQAPLYPYLLAGVYAVAGPSPPVVLVAQAFLGAASCVLVAWAARGFFAARVGWMAGGLLAVYPYAIFYGALLQKSGPALFVFCGLLALVGASRDTPGRWRLFAWGLALGVLILLRENAALLLPVVALLAWTRAAPTRPRGRLLAVALVCLGTAAALAPVSIRNAWHGGGFVPTTYQMGANLYIGNHRGASGRYAPLRQGGASYAREGSDALEIAREAAGVELSPAEVSRHWTRRTLGEIREAPGAWLRLLATKALLVWNAEEVRDTESPEVYADESWIFSLLSQTFHFGVLLPLAVWGSFATWRERRSLWFPYATLFTLAVSVVVFYVVGRYRFPMVPLLIWLAAAGIEASPRLFALPMRRLAPGVCAVVLSALLANWDLSVPAIDPRAQAWNELGTALRRAGRAEEALAYFDRSIARDERFERPHLNKAETLRRRGETRAALWHTRRAVLLNPESADAFAYLAAVLRDLGAPGASDAARRALRLRPTHPGAGSLLGLQLLDEGRVPEAIGQLREVVRRQPANASYRNNLAVALARAGRLEQARVELREALRLDPGYAPARKNLARFGGS